MNDGSALPDGPLDGLLVADFSRILAGPLATMYLGDLGADVVKVEHPAGDDTRRWGPPWDPSGEATYYQAVNRNKRSVTLDLKAPQDLKLARELARRADVLVENMRPGGMDRLGLGYDAVAETNRSLVYVSITGFGPDSDLPGYDLLIQAASGLMSVTGPEAGPSSKTGVAIVDVVAGLHAAIATLAALHERHASGRGQKVEVNLMQSALAALVNQTSGYLGAGFVPGRLGNAHPSIAPYESFAAADGPFIIAVGNDAQFRTLAEVLGRDDLADDERYATNAARVEHRTTLRSEIETATTRQPADHWIERLRARAIPAGPINDIAAAFAMAEEVGLRPTTSFDGFDGTSPPFELSRTPPSNRRRPPSLGVDDETVRAWLGG